MSGFNTKKFFLYLLIGSVSVSALIGIGVILLGNFGQFEIRILLTTLAITFMSLLGLACGVNLEAGRGKFVPYAGILFSLVAGIVWIILIWAENKSEEFFAKFVMSATILAVVFAHFSLIFLARLDEKYRWVLISLVISVVLLVAVLFGLIWATETFESDFIFRTLGVLGIVVSALTIVVPVFHKLSDNPDKSELIDREIDKLKKRITELENQREKIGK